LSGGSSRPPGRALLLRSQPSGRRRCAVQKICPPAAAAAPVPAAI